MTLLAFLLAAAAIPATALMAACSLRLRSLPSFLLAAYLIASAELFLLGEALSIVGAVGATGYALGQAVLLVASLWVWRARGRPLPPVPPVDLRAGIGRHPILAALGVVVGGALVYQLFIALATPPNNWDSMSYHLPRAAEWLQRARVEYVPDPPTERINALQPGSELEILWTLAFLGRDTAAALPQLFAEVASLVGVYAIARRIGFERPDSVFASLLAATLTQVALQSVTTQNDLLAASFVVAAAALVLGRSRAEVVLAGARARARARNQAHSGLCDPGPARARDHGPPAATARRVRRRGRRRLRPGRSLRLRPQRRRDGKAPRRPVRNRAVPTGRDHVGRTESTSRASASASSTSPASTRRRPSPTRSRAPAARPSTPSGSRRTRRRRASSRRSTSPSASRPTRTSPTSARSVCCSSSRSHSVSRSRRSRAGSGGNGSRSPSRCR